MCVCVHWHGRIRHLKKGYILPNVGRGVLELGIPAFAFQSYSVEPRQYEEAVYRVLLGEWILAPGILKCEMQK